MTTIAEAPQTLSELKWAFRSSRTSRWDTSYDRFLIALDGHAFNDTPDLLLSLGSSLVAEHRLTNEQRQRALGNANLPTVLSAMTMDPINRNSVDPADMQGIAYLMAHGDVNPLVGLTIRSAHVTDPETGRPKDSNVIGAQSRIHQDAYARFEAMPHDRANRFATAPAPHSSPRCNYLGHRAYARMFAHRP